MSNLSLANPSYSWFTYCRVCDLPFSCRTEVFLGGCHTSRDTVAAIQEAGFSLTRVDRFRFPPRPPQPASPHALGEAIRR